MKINRVGFQIVFAALISAFGYTASENGLKISVRVLNIPMLQSVTWGGDDGTGKIVGGTVGGDVTSAFPDGVVLIQCDTPSEISIADITKVIRDKVFFDHLDELKKTGHFPDIGIAPLGEHEYSWNGFAAENRRLPLEKEFYERSDNHSYPVHYWLSINPMAEIENEIAARVVFQGGFIGAPLSHGKTGELEAGAKPRWTKSEAPVLLDQTVGLRRGKTLLVGFPSLHGDSRGTIYWLAIQIIAPK